DVARLRDQEQVMVADRTIIHVHKGVEYLKANRCERGCNGCAFDVQPGATNEALAELFEGCMMADCLPTTTNGVTTYWVFRKRSAPLPAPTHSSVVITMPRSKHGRR
ncbi:MAG TPA: hypothetical protein PKN64_13060, partial [Casimicrobium sp.]|nr:hypothetical protein [Casimicrobium sp.]